MGTLTGRKVSEIKEVPLGVHESGVLELVGKNEEVNTSDYGGSVALTFAKANSSGELLSFTFIATEEGSGAVQDSAGVLYIFDADPNPTVGDTALTAAEHKTVVGKVTVAASDWNTDTGGGTAFIPDNPVPFHELDAVYLVWFHTDATDLNDAAGDDEVLEVNVWYRLDS